jgi:predicted ABC-type ATPase
MKDLVVIGGPNGAGKTTAAYDLLPQSLAIRQFVNADEIARGLSPFYPEGSAMAAGRIMLDRMHTLVEAGESFAFETTCASRGHGRVLRTVRELGYRVTLLFLWLLFLWLLFLWLLFLWLPSPEAAVERVSRRVRQGGHRIPADVVHRRYWAGLRNMRDLYLPLADIALIYDNSDNGRVLIAARSPDEPLVIHDEDRWHKIEEVAR